jgi:hypothetical protein
MQTDGSALITFFRMSPSITVSVCSSHSNFAEGGPGLSLSVYRVGGLHDSGVSLAQQ